MYDLITVRIVRTMKITTNYLSVQSIGIENTLKLLRSNHMNLYLIYCGQEHRKRIKKAHKSPICPIRSTKKARKHFERLAISSRSHFMQQNQKFMCSPYLPFNSRFICVII